jgi:hypothetical protein
MRTRSNNWYILNANGDYNKSAYDHYNAQDNVFKIQELLHAYQNEYIYSAYSRRNINKSN